ncbi:UrcA family protein [Sphingomonas sp. SM33]|uniref:UrcA family protein n=1 Tax=Sphingomonas telluris TaxID=2907998 RepID=A0ABS9VL39_9SPHN|nr:UrcA family protein [Sphingomonas telluris]MCH8615668.1 UrcA family protein [Sphingomonas telluris]
MRKSVLLLGSLLFASSNAFAQPPVVVTGGTAPFQVVSYADLNISSKAGQDRLVHRIRSAAEDICLDSSKEQVKFEAARRHCYSTALDSGMTQMNRAIAERANGATLATASLVISGR